MRVKRYVVNDLPDALPLIRSELGKDAVILNTKEIFVGGFMGLFRKRKMEVIAAIESGAAQQRPQTKPQARAQAAAASATIVQPTFREALQAEQYRPAEGVRMVETAAATAAMPPIVQQAAAPAAIEAQRVKSQAAPSVVQTATQEKVESSAVLDEIKSMRELIGRLAKQQDLEEEPEAYAAIRKRLTNQEVNELWINKLLEEVKAAAALDADLNTVRRVCREVLLSWMKAYEGEGVRGNKRVIHIVGPTGVGKTTTIAKLAAEQTLKARRKVGFITADTYRIAAVDQLRTYANILNVPMQVVFSPMELTKSFKELEDRDIIFMDTAGRNFRNDLYVSEVNSLMQTEESSDAYLVLSLTAKISDMEAVAERFSQYGITKLIFTKLDETDTYGSVLNMAMEHQLKTAYITFGQNVPDDIEPFRADNYVDKLLGAADYE